MGWGNNHYSSLLGEHSGRIVLRKDQAIQNLQIKTAKGCPERPIQLFYPLKLHCNDSISDETNIRIEATPIDSNIQKRSDKLNVNALRVLTKEDNYNNCVNKNDWFGSKCVKWWTRDFDILISTSRVHFGVLALEHITETTIIAEWKFLCEQNKPCERKFLFT